MTRADHERAQVYAAELAAFDGTDLEVVVPLAELLALATSLTAAAWWPRGPVPVRAARRDARSSTTTTRGTAGAGSGPVIRLAAPQRTKATLIHELAHVLAGVGAGHGQRFRRAHVDVAGAAFGSVRGEWLAQAYRGASLALAAREWPEPAAADRAPIAL